MKISGSTFNAKRASVRFEKSNTQTKLIVLLGSAKQLSKDSKTTRSGAFFSQRVQDVLKQFQQLSREDQQEALQEIVTGVPTRLTEAYKELDTNMKMVFWYRLTDDFQGNVLLSKLFSQTKSNIQENLMSELATWNAHELMLFLREAVATE
jgi:nitrogen fixation/metabolism regulation signal transduction histidine kinase